MHFYKAYGLFIEVSFPLPRLSSVKSETADVSVVLEPLLPLPGEMYEGAHAMVTPEGFYYIFWPEVAVFLLREGREILIDPLPGVVHTETLHIPLLGVVFGLLLHQRGLFTLHASAVSIDGGAVAFIGAKHAGKSTTAAALHAQGYPLLTDDLLALNLEGRRNNTVEALPGFPLFKLWPASMAALGDDPDAFPVIHPNLEKRLRDPHAGFQETPLPLKRIYVLAEGPQLSSVYLSARDAFVELLAHSYAARFLREAAAGPDHFQQCTRLVHQVPVCRLERPSDFAQLSSLVRFIENDCKRTL